MEAHVISNVIVFLLTAGTLVAGILASRSPYWRNVLRDLSRRKLAVAAFCVFFIYVLMALLDSVAWRDREPGTGTDAVAAREARTLVDRFFSRLGFMEKEESYSAPFSDTLFSGEAGSGETGDKESLKRPRGHPLGTDILGRDVLFMTFKGVRPAMTIGIFTTLMVIPMAVFFGVLAGYFGGRVDDVVQYVYTTLASIPSLLLLIALVMVMGRSSFTICVALSVTSWVGFCRLLRGETLKVRELEYVEAARSLGTGHMKIILKHVIPNVFHIIIINAILRFSRLVFSEAILSYLGLGLDSSWGSMIDQARDELARDPIIWWNLVSASVALFILVLAVNIFGDAVRDVLDPRTRRLAK